jgi:hypothetical protein
MMEELSRITSRSFVIKRGLWDSRPRTLHLHSDYIEFDDQSLRDEKPTRLLKEELKDYRFGIVWLHGLKFCIGRQYTILMRTINDRELKISFQTYYGIKKEILNEKYLGIVNTIINLYFADIVDELLKKFTSGESIVICGVELNKEAVILEHKGLFRNSSILIPWDDVKTRIYQTYYAICSSKNPADINKSYNYLEDYNAWTLRIVMEHILTEKQKVNDSE